MKTILRSISLPSDLDEVLRVLAFHKHCTKQELMLQFLKSGIESNRDFLEQWAPNVLPKK